MNASSKQPALVTINHWLAQASTKLNQADVPSAQLDAELILCHALTKDRTWLIAHGDDGVDTTDADSLLERRLKREPIAYIVGTKEFYGRSFTVSPDVLIPRPETETMIEILASLVFKDARMIDVGTGSGAIAVTAQLEFPELIVEACDISKLALKIARTNAQKLGSSVTFHVSDLLDDISETYDIICANLPYVDTRWEVSIETHFEPDLALFAKDDGLELIHRLIEQTDIKLAPNGFLLLEADPRQHDAIIDFAHSHGFDWYLTREYIVVLQKR